MQTVPSLVGTGTVAAAAAAGLAFGQPTETPTPSSPRPSSSLKRKLFTDFSFDNPRSTPTLSPLSPQGTSSAPFPQLVEDVQDDQQQHPSPLTSNPVNISPTTGLHITPPKSSSRRLSTIRATEVAAIDTGRDSISSHGSWIRRLSLRPQSQHGSVRSIAEPDSAVSYSQGSGPSILSPTGSVAPQLPAPNKLVKRPGAESIFARRGSRIQVPSLRRPATSHQRSATIQQVPFSPAPATARDGVSSGQPLRPRASTTGRPNNVPWRLQEAASSWTSYFHARRVRASRRKTVVTPISPSVEGSSPMESQLPGTRIHLRRGSLVPAPYLVNPEVITGDPLMMAPVERELESDLPAEAAASPRQSLQNSKDFSGHPLDKTPTKASRRSLSSPFGASGGWIARASSLRRPKRDSFDVAGGRRYASDPTSTSPKTTRSNGAKADMEALFTPPLSGYKDDPQNVAESALQEPRRDVLASIPPLSRLSSFHLDLTKMGSSPPHSAGLQAPSPIQISPTTAPPGAPFSSHSRAVSKEGASTLAGSEMSVPGLASGDDDDTDYKSDAVFDSFRTNDSNRFRMVETPLDSMFDESPLGTLGNVKAKRLSIQEILGSNWDGDTRIMEEDEGSSTPIRGIHGPHIADDTDGADDRATEIAKFQISIGNNNRNFGRLSLDTTDDDYDWARDDEDVLSHPLSPPTSSVNSRRGASPQLRTAMASISGNATPDSYTTGVTTERPRSNVFDWSESSHEKADDSFTRPRTAHGKKELDSRGGRPPIRPSAHVRSQSVPVVEAVDIVKGAPKFGTWGLSAKNASEDWDDDFEFDEGSTGGSVPKNPVQTLSMSVPPSIQTAQATVKAHSGHIREFSLLVDSLKRVCRQGRDLNLLNGQSALLWKEAENIIALASPDEYEADEDSSDSQPSPVDERFMDGGFDAASLDRADDNFEANEPDISKNAVIRERQIVRRRSVFSPDDDIFGNTWSLEKESTRPHTPGTPDRVREFHTPDGAVVSSVIAAMEQQRSLPGRRQESPLKPSKAKLFFDTNSLHELVRRASSVFHTLSDIVRKEELLSTSPQATPTKLDRVRPGHGGSPAFTRVFTDPDTSPPRHLVRSQKSHSPLPRSSLDSGLNQRMQMMTVS